MPARPRYQESHIEPRTVPLSDRLTARLADPGLDPEAALIASQEVTCEERAPRELLLDTILPGDALAIDWWVMGLTHAEIGGWMGCARPRVTYRILRGLRRLRAGRT